MRIYKISLPKKILAVCMMFVMAFMLAASPIKGTQSKAAEVKSHGEYIKEVKLFVKSQGTVDDAKAWCESQEGDWKVLEGDENGNLNSKASGALTKEVGVFLCYTTTSDPDEAITDLAVMNEKGNYSEGEYQMLLNKQKDEYIDMVNNMKGMIEEYRTNYANKTPMALRSYNYLNNYKDDESGKLLGDLMLEVSDEQLANILLQCNGMVFLTLQERLAAACDTAKTTWLDRMVKLGSYNKLKAAFSKNAKGGNVEKALEKKYKENASRLLDCWDDMHKHIENAKKFEEENGLLGATQEQVQEWVDNLAPEAKAYASYTEYLTIVGLAKFKYGEKTLLDFFNKTKAEIEEEGIEALYPMAACITEGQMCAMKGSLGLYQMVQEAMAAAVVNNNNEGAMEEKQTGVSRNELKKTLKALDAEEKEISGIITDGEKVSIYEGVDRDVFKGGVAVTTDAKNLSGGTEGSWTDLFCKNGSRGVVGIAMDATTLGTAVAACMFAVLENHSIMKEMSNAVRQLKGFRADSSPYNFTLAQNTKWYINVKTPNLKTLIANAKNGDAQAIEALNNLEETTMERNTSWVKFDRLKAGFAAFTILLAVADIALSVYSLYKYYNADHLPIPHHMVDMSYNKSKEASYVAYKSVLDQDGNYGDLNGNNSRQWLALYYTKDKAAGAPILAPTEKGKEMLVKTGTTDTPGDKYSPLHMFGTVNVAQNLTFADGDNGYSFNDKVNGTYLYFTHADVVTTYGDAAADQAGTVLSGGMFVLIGAIGIVVGIFIGIGVTSRRRKTVKE